MDNNNWRPTPNQGSVGGAVGGVGGGAGEPTMDTGDWRTQLPPDSRQRIVNKIMDTLKRHLPVSGQDGLHELRKIAIRFEEKIYTAATNQGDYLRKISLKMLTMESKSQNPTTNSLTSNSAGNSNKPPDSGMLGMQTQVHNQGQSLPIPLQSQARQQLLSQNIQNNVPSAGVQSSTSLPSTLPTVSGLNQAPISNVVGQNTNMQNISGNSQNPVGNSMGQGVPSNMFTNNQRQMQGRQQVVPLQQQQQSQNQHQYMYQQQLQQKLLKQKIQQGNIPHALMQSHIQQQQQQQQQNLLQNNQLQSSQQSIMQSSSVMQPSVMQSSSLSVLQQNQQPSIQQATQNMLQQHSQSVLRQPQQAAVIHPQQTQMQQQQQQLMGQQPNATNMQQNQLIAQPSSVGDMQQQQQRLLGQQNNLQNMQQQQQQHQLMAQQNNLSNMHQQLGSQSNVSGLQQQQQQLLGAQSVNSSMQTSQHSVHMLQQSKVPVQQQSQHTANFLPTQGQLSQSQPQPPQQQLMSQIQSQPSQLQQQLGLQPQPNTLQRDMQQRLQASGQVSLQPQNVIDQQKQFYQRAVPDTSSTSLDSTAQTGHGNGGDWQEEVYQKIKAMKEMHLPELNEMYQKIAAKVQQQDSLSQQPKSDQLEKLKTFKTMLERLITFLQVSKDNILPYYKEKLGLYEKQILNFINTNRPRKPVSSPQQGQLPPPHMHSLQQQPQSQTTQMQSHESQMNPQLQSMNLQGSVATMQQNNMTSLQHNSLSLSGVSTAQQNMMNSLQLGFNLDSGQGNALSSLQPVAMGSLQQNPVSAPQQANLNNYLSAQSGVNVLQPTINSLQSSSNMLEQQHLEQHQEQQMMQQTQQLKQQYQQQLMQKQQLMQQQQQQLHEQPKQQMSAQLQSEQIPQLHQINDANDLKIQQGLGVKLGVFQQHLPAGQRAAYPHQQLKPGASFPTSSPQLLQAASPQILQHSSPQADQQNVLSSITKAGTPMQSANSPFVVPSPSTCLAPPPMPGDSEKPISGVSSLSNAGNIGHQQTSGVGASALSLAIGTPGISASPLLAEFTGQEGTHGNALMNVSGKWSITEQPLECLIEAVKSMSPKSLSASVSDIGSVVSMIDRVAGSAPGSGSRAAVGADLEAMTKLPFLDKVIEDVNKHRSRRWIVKAGNFFNIYVFGSWQFLTLFAAICLMVLMSL